MTQYAIIENEEFSRINLDSQIQLLRPDWKLSFTAETVEDSVEFFLSDEAKSIDIVFMDIELDDGNCFDIFRQLSEANDRSSHFDIPVIFTTSYDQYAIKAFSVNSIDYILKPVMDEDLKRAIEKFERTRKTAIPMDIDRLLETFSSSISQSPVAQTKPASRILITTGDSYQYLEVSSIAFFLAEDKAVLAVLKDSGRRRVTDFSSLGDVLPALPQDDFFQLSRSVITSIGAIEKVSKYFKGRLLVTLKAGETKQEVIVTAARKSDFLSWYGFKS